MIWTNHLRKSVFGKMMMCGGVDCWLCHIEGVQELKEELVVLMIVVITLNVCNNWWQDVLILMTSNTMLMMIVMIMCRILKALLVLSY